jgi:hypothetical protein
MKGGSRINITRSARGSIPPKRIGIPLYGVWYMFHVITNRDFSYNVSAADACRDHGSLPVA